MDVDNDLISRAAIIREIKRIRKSAKTLTGIDFLRMIDTFPAVDAAPVVHGRWMEIEDSWGDCHYQCTECGEEWNLEAGTPAENNMNYCPKCGAKMDGGDDDEAN